MDVNEIETKILKMLGKREMSTGDIEKELDSKSLEECSDKIVYALIRLKNKGKVKNSFKDKQNVWSKKV